MAKTSLPDNHHVVRHLKPKLIERDDSGNIKAVFPQAFQLRENEKYLSMCWLEYFAGTDMECLAGIANALRSRRTVKADHAFAIARVDDVKEQCGRYGVSPRILSEPTDHNPAYATVRRYESDETRLLDLLAREAFSRVIGAAAPCEMVGPFRPR